MQKKTIAGLIAIVAIVAAVIFAGCVKEPPSAPTVTPTRETEMSLGQSAMLGDIEFTVVRFEESNMYELNKTPNETVYPAEGAKFLWVYVRAKNVGEVARKLPDKVDMDMLYKGEEIMYKGMYGDEPIGRKMYEDYMDEIYPNVIEEGWILFEVPEKIDLSQVGIRITAYTYLALGSSRWNTEKMTWSLAP